MTIWAPRLSARVGPLYRRITEALAEDILAGRLPPASRLPTQRELAERLGVTVTTVTRAYAEAKRRGLVSGEVGRGTFVHGAAPDEPDGPDSAPIELGINALFPHPFAGELAERLAGAAARATRGRLFDYQPHGGVPRHRAAGAAWIASRGVPAPPERVLVTAGAQHALAVVFLAITRPGDLVLAEPVTYPGMRALAERLGLRLRGVAMDAEGLRPEALRAACRAGGPKALYLMPTMQNPVSTVLSERRRRAIAAVARAHDLAIVEDDSYGFLLPKPAPLAAFAPERTYFVTGTSKPLAPGLRVGFVLAPAPAIEPLTAAIFATAVHATPLTADLASEWLGDGTAERIAQWKREEIAARQRLARSVLDGLTYDSHPASPHLWLRLAAPWTATAFAVEARARGVLVTPADEFAIDPGRAPAAVRVCLGPPRDRTLLERGLGVLAELADQPRPLRRAVV